MSYWRKLSGMFKATAWPSRYSWKKWAAMALVLFGVSVCVHVLRKGIWLSCLENASLDAMLNLGERRVSDRLVIVQIDDDDYKTLFHETSPLSPHILRDLIEAIAAGKPRVIGVDLDTSPQVFRKFEISPSWPPIIWAQSLDSNAGNEPVPILGGRNLRPLAGIALSPMDGDCNIRFYQKSYSTSRGPLPSFPQVIAARAQSVRGGRAQSVREDVEPHILTGFHVFPKYSAQQVLAASRQPMWSSLGPFQGKIVLLGGTYRAGRDLYSTPLGVMSGVEIMAQAVEVILSTSPIEALKEWIMVALEVISGLFIVFLNRKLDVRPALLLSLAYVALLAPLASLMLFYTLAYWANFVPILVGVILHQVYEQAESYHRLLEQRVG
jgi:CHASE2 domain-containing sensor protein